MPAARPATPVFSDAAHRHAVMRRLVWRIPLGMLAFVLIGPLIGMVCFFLLVWCLGWVANPAGALEGISSAPLMFLFGAPIAYLAGGIPAAMTGLWVTLLAIFERSRLRLYGGSAAIGASMTWLCAAALTINAKPQGLPHPSATILAVIGAVSAVACTYLLRGWLSGVGALPAAPRKGPLFESRNRRRYRLARARAERLAKERAKA